MIAGTGSDVGKSIIAAGLCRVFMRDGYAPAPFKAQNMALNSYVTPDGLEIGRAQAVQAEAAGVECMVDMNPLLLKPTGDSMSQVVLNGKPVGNASARGYFHNEGRRRLVEEVHRAYDRLASRFNPIVLEGAGSIAEINLREFDLVNMSMARYAGADVILVSDIDRGGVFASAYGSVMLQPEEDRKCIKGIIVNKFRGDISLFDSGRRMLEDICGVPVLGVVPYMTDIHIDEEDSVALSGKSVAAVSGKVNVAVVKVLHISNYTDFNRLENDERVNLYYASAPGDLDSADIVILPGSKSTVGDLEALYCNGMAAAVISAAGKGKTVIGICGGYQMMGCEVTDPLHVESDRTRIEGLGLLPVNTMLTAEKTTRRVTFAFNGDTRRCLGYEIHMGDTIVEGGGRAVNCIDGGVAEGCMAGERCFGTYIHGILDNDSVVEYILSPYLHGETALESDCDYREWRDRQYDLLAERLRKYIDMTRLYEIMRYHD